MKLFPQQVLNAWGRREDNVVLSTVSPLLSPNSIWILCADIISDDGILIADNFMHKTLTNVLSASRGSLLMLAPQRESYQFVGQLAYHQDDAMHQLALEKWPRPKFAVKGAVSLTVDEIYAGAERIV